MTASYFVILSVSEESLPLYLYIVILSVAKNLIFSFQKDLKHEILHFIQDDKEGRRSFGLKPSG
jgi:hypothetical protein